MASWKNIAAVLMALLEQLSIRPHRQASRLSVRTLWQPFVSFVFFGCCECHNNGVSVVAELALQLISSFCLQDPLKAPGAFLCTQLPSGCPRVSPLSALIFHNSVLIPRPHHRPFHSWQIPFHLHSWEKVCFQTDRQGLSDGSVR